METPSPDGKTLTPKGEICDHCGQPINTSATESNPPPLPTQQNQHKKSDLPWYFRTSIIVLLLLSVGPLALPLVWFHPSLSRLRKLVVTLIVLVLTYALWLLTVFAYELLLPLLEKLETIPR